MHCSAYDLKAFYNTKMGRVVRRILQDRIRTMWPDVSGYRVLGCGYAMPYLKIFLPEAERVIAHMPVRLGVHNWPHDDKNLVCFSQSAQMPFENSSVDRVLMIHDLEFSDMLQPKLQEIHRVLKANGKLLVIVPNRNGLWARADWSPFGKGSPYSATQITNYLHENMFVHEQTEEALFMPPVRRAFIYRSSRFFERFGKQILPIVSGVHMVEVSKQLYAQVHPGGGSKVPVGRGFVPRPIPQG